MALKAVTDPALLAQLGSASPSAPPAGLQPVTDPGLLDKLNGGAQEQPAQESSFANDLGRAAAMQGASLVKGAADLVALPSDTIVRLLNAAGVTNWKPAAQSINEALDSITPAPQNAIERGTNRVVEGLGGAAAGIGAGALMGGAVGGALASAPGRQAVGAITGAAAAQTAQEAGGGPIAQAVSGMAGGVAGAGALRSGLAAGTKAAVRGGGEAARFRTAENIQSFENAGANPSVGQATQNRTMQATESLFSRTPGAAGRMVSTAEQQAKDLGAGVEQKANALSPNSGAEQAGRAIERGVRGEGGFIENFKAKQKDLYDQLDPHIQPQTGVNISGTLKALEGLNAPIKGAENTSKFFQNSKMKGIEGALKQDVEDALQQAADSGGTLPYEAVKKLRTLVGNEMADSSIMSDVPRSKWKALYGALSTDLEGAAKASGPDATRAWNRANNFTRAGMRRLETIDHVIEKNGGPEAVFTAALSGTKEGATTLRAVMQSLPEDAQKTVSATVLKRLGRATPGKQNDLGDKFSTETFLTNWNGMSPQAKAVLFERYGPQFRQDMDQVAKVASNLRDGSKVWQNPSGTGQAAAQTGAIAAFVASLFSGHPEAAAGVAGGAVGANLSARLMTHPPFVKWLAKTTRLPSEAVPVALTQLANSDDPLMQEAAQALQEAEKNRGNGRNQQQKATERR